MGRTRSVNDHQVVLHPADLELAVACAAGDASALSVFYDRYRNHIVAVVRRMRVPEAMIDDIAQLVAERLFVARAGVRPKIADYDGRGSLASWLRVVSVRVALNALRGGNGRQLPLDDAVLSRLTASKDPALELIKCAYRDDFAAAFRSALAELPARSQNLLRHHLIDLLAPEQIGRLYRVHRTTAMRWLDTARELLIKKTREHLSARLALNAAELDSLLHVMSSQLELTPMLRGIDPGA